MLGSSLHSIVFADHGASSDRVFNRPTGMCCRLWLGLTDRSRSCLHGESSESKIEQRWLPLVQQALAREASVVKLRAIVAAVWSGGRRLRVRSRQVCAAVESPKFLFEFAIVVLSAGVQFEQSLKDAVERNQDVPSEEVMFRKEVRGLRTAASVVLVSRLTLQCII